jgi:hypothetical protein
MKNKRTVLNSLLIMLAGLIHSPAQAPLRCRFTSSMSKKVMQQIGLAVFLYPIIK